MNRARNMENAWSDLPTDLLLLIFNSETLNIPDLISFSSVCTSWRLAAATSRKRRHFRYQSPWLMFAEKEDPNSALLYSFSKNKVYTIPNQPNLPIANRKFIGSAHGWLITADEKSELSLLNPITRQQIELPPVSTFEGVRCLPPAPGKEVTYDDLRDEYGFITYFTAESLRHMLYDKATISSSPASGDYVVVLVLLEPYCFAVARAEDTKWTMVHHNLLIYDLAFHDDGKMYTTDATGSIDSWVFNKEDLTSTERQWVYWQWLPQTGKTWLVYYLVRAPRGELLLVQRDRGKHVRGPIDYTRPTRGVAIWRIEVGTIEKRTEVKNLGDYALFLGGFISTCVSCKDNPEIRGNCVYFVDECYGTNQYEVNTPTDVCIFNLEDGSMEHILPNHSRIFWPPPIWIMPSLA